MKFIHFTARLFLPILSTERVVTPQRLGFQPTDRSNVGDAPTGAPGQTTSAETASPSAAFTFTTAMLLCATPNAIILDNTTISTTLNVATLGTLLDMNVSVSGTHTWVGDLTFTLTHPSGVTASFTDRPGVPTTINGYTWGGTAIHTDLVAGQGLFLEFGNNVLTTRIQQVRIVRPEPAGRIH